VPPSNITDFRLANPIYDNIEHHIEWADVVYFLAGSVGVHKIVTSPRESLDNNIGLAFKLVPLFEKHHKRVIFASTSEVYGEGPFIETSHLTIGAPPNLRWSYASAKLTTEFMIAASTFPYVILRFFNIVGPGQTGEYGMVLPRFVAAAKKGDPIVVYGSGKQCRTFCHVTDAIHMMLKVENAPNQIFNVGSSNVITVNQLAERVRAATKSESRILHKPLSDVYTQHYGDIHTRIPDLTKITQYTDYMPQYTIDHIIQDVI
jgi:UDP-glucose 4-epimerase